MNLTKKYRIIWELSSKMVISGDPSQDLTGSITIFNNAGDMGYFESDIYSEIEQKIIDEQLVMPSNE